MKKKIKVMGEIDSLVLNLMKEILNLIYRKCSQNSTCAVYATDYAYPVRVATILV